MAKLTTHEPVRFELPGQDDLPEAERAAVYIQPPTGRSWRGFQRALAADAGDYVDDRRLLKMLREGLHAIEPDPDSAGRQEAEALIDGRLAEIDGDEPGDPAAALRLAEYEQVVRDHYPAYADAVAARAVWMEAFAAHAVQRFVVDWDGICDGDGEPVPCRREAGMLAEDLVYALPAGWRNAIAGRVAELHRPKGRELGNSRSRSRGRPTAGTSATTSPTADGSDGSADDTATATSS